MVMSEIDEVVEKIYQGEIENINTQIIEVLTQAYKVLLASEDDFIKILKIVESEIQKSNYIYIADLLNFELKMMIGENNEEFLRS